MRVFLLISIASLFCYAAAAGEAKTPAYPVKYEGGNLHLTHRALKATLGSEQIVLRAGHQSISVPASAITEIAFGNNVRRRFGAPVLDVVPFMKLGEAESHYVGVSWTNGDSAAKSEALFRLSSSEYHDFLAALERLTGKKAVDTNQVPTVVRYGL
jgi:hypothetical protein